MSDAPRPRTSRRIPPGPVIAFVAISALGVVGTLEWRANRAHGAAVRTLDARMAGAEEASALPTRAEVERLIDRRAVGPPAKAADGTLAVAYRWPSVFRSYGLRAYYSSGAAPRLVRFETAEPVAGGLR